MIEARPCRTCKAPVYDLLHERTGKPAPINAEPDTKGNIAIDAMTGTYLVIKADERLGATVPLYTNHWATCPDAPTWRERLRQRVER